MKIQEEWWHKAVFYQIYPRSFKDSTNNGVGDLQGIISKLDYLENLGIDAIWFSPFFASPQKDFGYDISNYRKIHPNYGTMEDFDELIELAHEKNLKIILDLVLNHTSDQHCWFQTSKTNKVNEKKDWYVWQDGQGIRGKRPPNNWKAIIGGSAWEWCEARQQFYLHQFLPCQPDLNWWNPAVQEAMLGHLKFWLDKGVDGFRLDIIHTLFEDKNFRDNPMSRRLFPNKNTNAFLFQKPKYTQFLPETIAICKELRKIVDSYSPPRMLVGEAVGNPELYKPLYGKNNNGLHLVFNFAFGEKPFSAQEFRKGLLQSERLLPEPFWPCYVFSNHDSVRMISRYGNNPLKARLITMLLLTIRGTPFIYMGEEIGMRQVSVPRKQQKDPIAFHRLYGIPIGRFFGRDGCRTPFQWTASPLNAGFSQDPTVSPWLPVHENCSKINVQDQLGKENSMLTYYQQLLQLRKKHPALQTGTLTILPEKRKHLLTYTRNHKKETLVILLNFSTQQKHVPLFSEKYQFIFSSQFSGKPTQIEKQVILLPFEGKIMQKLVV